MDAAGQIVPTEVIPTASESYFTNGGRIGIIASESIQVPKVTLNSINAGTSGLNVADTAQEHTQAINNVNAVASNVFIQQNLNFIFNSRVQNLQTSNRIEIQSIIPQLPQ